MLSTLLPALVALAGAQDPTTATDLLPLQHLCTSERIYRSPAWGSLLQSREHNESRFVPNNGDLGLVTPDGIVNTLYGFMPAAIDEERLFLQPIDNNLLVVGESQLVDRVRSYLAEGAGVLARPVQLRRRTTCTDTRRAELCQLCQQAHGTVASGQHYHSRSHGWPRTHDVDSLCARHRSRSRTEEGHD
jgi:hypothetical protein